MRDVASVEEKIDATSQQKNSRVYGLEAHHNPENLRRDPRFTDASKKLSKKEMALLYEDIVKPLDVYSILIEKRKDMSERKWMNFTIDNELKSAFQ